MPPAPPGLARYYSQTLDWSSCQGDFECAVMEVPLDYAQPDGQSIDISLIRLTSPKAVGSIVLNPGGPGGSGIDYVRAARVVTTDLLRSAYDIVGFDPRGVGESTPVRCMTDEQTDEYIAADGSPDDQGEVDDTVRILTDIARGCVAKSPDLYPHVDTVSAARDVDILRAALGEPRLNWLGKSYGTFLGATYADLFPKNVGRMVLDGAIDPTLSNEQLSYGQALGFENALRRFIADCPSHTDCPLKAGGQAGYREVLDLFDELDRRPVRLADGREFTQAMGVTGVVGSLYDKVYGWSELRASLGEALDGNVELLAQTVDLYTSRDGSGRFTSNSNDAILAVNCLDRPDRATVTQTAQLAKAWAKESPAFGAYLAWSNVACTYWQAPASGQPHTITAVGAPEILVVGTTNDPATPYDWAQGLADQLASGVLLTLDGDGHTAYMQGSACVDQVVDQYFLTGQAAVGVTCSDGP
jgi:pimeloyl-ACP methyl ester carboxylesterase